MLEKRGVSYGGCGDVVMLVVVMVVLVEEGGRHFKAMIVVVARCGLELWVESFEPPTLLV